jgi:hypothetical protein
MCYPSASRVACSRRGTSSMSRTAPSQKRLQPCQGYIARIVVCVDSVGEAALSLRKEVEGVHLLLSGVQARCDAGFAQSVCLFEASAGIIA